MANYANLKAAIQNVIKTNGNEEITGALLQQSLLAMINSLGGYYQFAGIATPSTNPGTPDQNVFYLASTAGTYSNFGSIIIAENEAAILKYNGTWSKDSSGFATSEKVNQLQQEVTELGNEVNISFEGAGATFSQGSKLKLLQGKKYRFTIERVPWPVDSTGSSEVSMFQITSVNNGVETNLAYVRRTNYSGIKGFYDVTIPADSEYVYVGGRANSGYVVKLNVQLIDYFLELDTKTQETANEVVSLSAGNYPILHNAHANAYINNVGKLTTYNGWMATDYIPVEGLPKIHIYSPVASNYNAWYSDKNESAFIGQIPVAAGDNTFLLAPGAKYIRLSNTNAAMSATKMMDAANTKVEDVEESLEVVNDGLKVIGQYVMGEYVNNSTGAFESSTSYKRTGYIPVSDYHGKLFFVSDVRTPYCCFYDSNKAKVGTFVIQVGETFVDIPSNAAYCAFSLSRYSGTITMYDSTYSAVKNIGFDNIFDIQPKYQHLTDILAQMIRKPLILVWTDLHAGTQNFERMNRFYLDNLLSNVWFPLNLGDVVEDQATDIISFLDNELGRASLMVIGNHDVLVSGTLPGITRKAAYDKYIAPNVSSWGVTQPSGAAENGYNYYYKDKSYSQGTIRTIVLDEYFYDETQHNWFVATLADAVTRGYYVVVCQHQSNVVGQQASALGDGYPFATPELGFELYITTAGYSGNYASAAENRAMAVNDFIGNGGKFICWMSGHTHSDQCHTFTKSNGKQLSLVFSNAGMSMTSSIRVAGYSSDCFQYVAFDLVKKYVYVLRIGESVDQWFHKNSFMCYDFANHRIVEYY